MQKQIDYSLRMIMRATKMGRNDNRRGDLGNLRVNLRMIEQHVAMIRQELTWQLEDSDAVPRTVFAAFEPGELNDD